MTNGVRIELGGRANGYSRSSPKTFGEGIMNMITHRKFLRMASFVSAVLTALPHLWAAPNPAERPNIIFIMADDHCKQAISSYGGTVIETPNIDRLSKQGCRFDRMFSNNAICGPARACLLTGKYSHNNGYTTNRGRFDRTQTTFPRNLQKLGYETSIFGKWHLGSEPSGFDYFKLMKGHGRYYDCPLKESGRNWNDSGKVHKGYLTDVITDESIAWLKNRKNKKQPFMMMVHHKAPHSPHDPAPRHKNLFANTRFPEPDTLFDDYTGRMPEKIANKLRASRLLINKYPEYGNLVRKKGSDKEKLKEIYQAYMKGYLRLVASLDENVGRLLDFVEQEGLAKNTIIIYTSDNGFFLGEHGFMNKMWIYEPALHLPFIMRYPDHLAPGSTENAMLSWVDVAPTLIELAGGDAPKEMDGRSFKPILDGEPITTRQEVFYEFLAERHAPKHKGLRTEQYKIAYYSSFEIAEGFRPMWELFDLKNDPEEMNNIIDDPKYRDIVKELKTQLKKYMD